VAGRFTMLSYVPMLARLSRLQNLRRSQNFESELSFFENGLNF
jgi:hypothetical protein